MGSKNFEHSSLLARPLLITCLLAVVAIASGCAQTTVPESLAVVGGHHITAAEFDAFVETLPPQWKSRRQTPSGRLRILRELIRRHLVGLVALDMGLVAAEGKTIGLDVYSRDTSRKVRQHWRQSYRPSEREVQQYYDAHVVRFTEPPYYRLQEILVRRVTDATDTNQVSASSLRTQALSMSFEEIARQQTNDTSIRVSPDLGYIRQDRLPYGPAYAFAVTNMEPGELSEVIKSGHGLHVVKLVDKRPAKVRAFEEVRDDIEATIRPAAQQKYVEAQLRAQWTDYAVVIHEPNVIRLSSASEQ